MFKKYEFNITFIPTIAFIVACICFILLGFWQLDRANEKNSKNSNYTLRQADSSIDLNKELSIENEESILCDVFISGHIAKFPTGGISLGQENIETLNSSVFRMQKLEIDELRHFLTFNLLPYMIYLDPLIDKGNYSTFKLPAPGSEKNYGYAFQWFAFAFTLLIIFIKIGVRRKNVIKSKK